ncbi:MAG TPA: hypothetical protein VMU87_09730 [Stellaceae bacterium]|nr:hypothetical protein [Stellaceae bacterium]
MPTLAGAAAIVAGCVVLFASESPDAALRGDLAAAAAAVGALPPNATARDVTQALKTPLRDRVITVDATRFPTVVGVTFHALDQRSCIAARASARRLEGAVVVELDGYDAPADCRGRNDMTWHFMP